ncbi:poly(A) polymerase [Ketogulonicigenium robustum]|uniref:Poly(A) polymerase n=1 Tax=Ketogulonicigenium robustum TaxID=92947 RepID=A0A1W6P2L1_9RHOB|nr:CCA tRNA nucleotidyltransferase [Ketogulonicigenium robustum]ARO15674.1 poly(A) polymerase [Ketogulonicigenium robustum]
MRIEADWLGHPALAALMQALADAGFRAWFVGGCVRNALIGGGPTDVDMATDASPLAAKAALSAFRTIDTGIDHGTITVLTDAGPIEVTTLRRDVETDGRHAVVAFGTSLADDAARRDFTMNALYADLDGTVTDLVGGVADAQVHHVRFIGDAPARIREDYLRILRFFRFHAWYGEAGAIDLDGLSACAELADGIEGLSRERIGAEMRKLLSAPDPAPAVAAMAQAGVLWRILPGAGLGVLTALVHVEGLMGLGPDPMRRLAALGGEDAVTQLRLSKAEQRRLAHLTDGLSLDEAAYRHGADLALDAAALAYATLSQTPPDGLSARAAWASTQVFPLRAADLPLSGPDLGAALKAAERRWIASGFTLTKDALKG